MDPGSVLPSFMDFWLVYLFVYLFDKMDLFLAEAKVRLRTLHQRSQLKLTDPGIKPPLGMNDRSILMGQPIPTQHTHQLFQIAYEEDF
jgi:hypothetical protein